MRACTCDTGGNPASYEGPDRECPQHGDINARYGLNKGPGLLGLSYRALAKRVAAVRILAWREERDDRALHLISDVLAAVSAQSTEELRLQLEIVTARVTEWRADLAGGAHVLPVHLLRCPAFGDGLPRPTGAMCDGYYLRGHHADHLRKVHGMVDLGDKWAAPASRVPEGLICVDPRCPAGHAHYGPCPGPHSVDSVRPSALTEDEQRRQFAALFPGYCTDGTCGTCPACELRKEDGS